MDFSWNMKSVFNSIIYIMNEAIHYSPYELLWNIVMNHTMNDENWAKEEKDEKNIQF